LLIGDWRVAWVWRWWIGFQRYSAGSRVAGNFVDLEAFEEQDPDADVGFFVGGQPDFVVDEGLLENEAGSLLQVWRAGRRRGGNPLRSKLPGGRLVLLFSIQTKPATVDDFFDHFSGLVFRIAFEIED